MTKPQLAILPAFFLLLLPSLLTAQTGKPAALLNPVPLILGELDRSEIAGILDTLHAELKRYYILISKLESGKFSLSCRT